MSRLTQRVIPALAAAASLAAGSAVAADYSGTADDYAQISVLMTKYSYTLDNRDAKGWASVFTEDGMFRAAMFCLMGRKELAGLIDKMNARPATPESANRPKTHHIESSLSIDYLDRDHALSHSFVMVVGDVGRNHVGGGIETTGTYEDKLTRVNGRWLIADRLEVSPGDGPPLQCPPASH
jgi:SnoaL-like domain